MQTFKIILAVVVGIPLLVVAVFWLLGFDKLWTLIAGPSDMGAVDFATFSKTAKPNQHLVCPQDFCRNQTPDEISKVYALPANELSKEFLKSLKNERDLEQVGQDMPQLRFVQRTAKMRYPDTIRVEFITVTENTSSLAIYSQSQIGYRDFGVNRARVTRWLKRLEEFEAN